MREISSFAVGPVGGLARTLAVVTAAVLAAAACGGAGSSSGGTAKHLRFAFFAASSQNGFDAAIYQGAVQEADKVLGKNNYSMRLFDGQFTATVQYNQVQSAAAAKQYDGAIIEPNDNVGIAPAVEQAIQGGIKFCTTLFPIGPDMGSLNPQVNGLTCTAANPPAPDAKLQAQQVVTFCQSFNPCRVVLFIGQLQFPFDKLRYDTWTSVLNQHSNIQVVATGQGNYDRNTSLTAMTNILQAHPQFEVLLSNADQQVEGAQIALQNRGWDLKTLVADKKLYIMGGGATQEAVAAVRGGLWNATLAYYPVTNGQLAMAQLINALQGKAYSKAINMDQQSPLPLILTKQVLDQHSSFQGQWSG
jgi:ribose transport system substrate-binding protein